MRWGFLLVGLVAVAIAVVAGAGAGTNSIVSAIRKLFHQMARWSTAASQDENALVATLHANYGVGYMSALREIASDAEISAATGVGDLRPVFDEVQGVQNRATLSLLRQCPSLTPASPLAVYGSEGIPSTRGGRP